jgi:hypothetical protein
MITFAEARMAAVNTVARAYPLGGAAYAAAREGWQDDESWHVTVGDFRFIVKGDERFRASAFPDVAVDKRTGEVTVARDHLAARPA